METFVDAELLGQYSTYFAGFVGVGISLAAIGWGIGYVICVIARTAKGG